ncbi:hypothetical protein PVK06_002729 [Gossypium arboreum]|uniref:Uncharacterized protein n=1 Tax=Gossypium arboreum TaxID=29729 RepID=A0ABR0R5H2_GOSAR|nr:hypothetical protein PVK06_002729 [Gossypium arboreum]
MATSLNHFDEKHISTTQVVMADDRVLEGTIYDLAMPLITKLRGYLQEAGFLHTSICLGATNLILHSSVRWWKDGSLKHTFSNFHGLVVTKSTIVPNKQDICAALLGKVPNSFEGVRIWMKWLETNFNKLPLHAIDVAKEQYTQAFIMRLIGGILMPNTS